MFSPQVPACFGFTIAYLTINLITYAKKVNSLDLIDYLLTRLIILLAENHHREFGRTAQIEMDGNKANKFMIDNGPFLSLNIDVILQFKIM